MDVLKLLVHTPQVGQSDPGRYVQEQLLDGRDLFV